MSQNSSTASEHLPLSYRPDIDGLRAIAVLAVVFFHAFPAWLPGGFAGVDIFFVISGYLISYIVIADAQAGADFISPLDYLCDKSGCLISASKTKFEPMAYDLSHMTYPGSIYFDDRAISKATFSQ